MSPPASTATARSARPAPRRPNAPATTRARLKVAPEVARKRQLRARLLVWGSVLVTVVSMFLLVAFHVWAAQSAFSLDRLAKERTNEQLRYERLRLQVATSSSAESVIAAAHKLGMVPGSNQVFLTAPIVAPPNVTSATVPAPLAPSGYATTKSHLDDNP